MYKKHLTVTTIVYVAFLAFFSACTLADAEKEIVAHEIVPVSIVEAAEAEPIVQEIDGTVEEENEAARIPSAENSNEMGNDGMSDSSNRPMSGNQMMDGSNSMAGNAMMEGSNSSVPEITDLPDAGIDTPQERDALALMVKEEPIARLLANYSNWQVEIWRNDEENVMEIDFYDTDWNWLAWGSVSIGADNRPVEVIDIAAPNLLTDEEFVQGQKRAEQLALTDEAVLEAVGDLADWEMYSWYDEWQGSWTVGFFKGLDELGVVIEQYEDEWWVSDIRNLALLEEEQQQADNQNQAIEIAWQAEGIDEALFGGDEELEWSTVVTHIGGSEYGVSFVSADRELFFALVDIEADMVLE